MSDEQRERQDRTVERIAAVARECGYAVAVHGSRVRDLDLVAVPWVEECKGADALLDALVDQGFVYTSAAVGPHGRVSLALHGGVGARYVDLSIVPRHEFDLCMATIPGDTRVLFRMPKDFPVTPSWTQGVTAHLHDVLPIEIKSLFVAGFDAPLEWWTDEMLSKAGLQRVSQ